MMRMKTHQASGRASALRVGHTLAPTANFKTRFDPCRIVVCADLEKCEQFKEIDHEALTSARHPAINRAESHPVPT